MKTKPYHDYQWWTVEYLKGKKWIDDHPQFDTRREAEECLQEVNQNINLFPFAIIHHRTTASIVKLLPKP